MAIDGRSGAVKQCHSLAVSDLDPHRAAFLPRKSARYTVAEYEQRHFSSFAFLAPFGLSRHRADDHGSAFGPGRNARHMEATDAR